MKVIKLIALWIMMIIAAILMPILALMHIEVKMKIDVK